MKADGTIVQTNHTKQFRVSDWRLFGSIDTLNAERKAAAERAEAERMAKVKGLKQEKASLQAELSTIKVLFTGKRRKEIEARLAEIEEELKKLE